MLYSCACILTKTLIIPWLVGLSVHSYPLFKYLNTITPSFAAVCFIVLAYSVAVQLPANCLQVIVLKLKIADTQPYQPSG